MLKEGTWTSGPVLTDKISPGAMVVKHAGGLGHLQRIMTFTNLLEDREALLNLL